MNKRPQFAIAFCISFGSAFAQADPVILGSENIAGTADVLLLEANIYDFKTSQDFKHRSVCEEKWWWIFISDLSSTI